jgi:hypothetical protein
MTTDSDMKIDYSVVLKQLQQELGSLDARRHALEASIASMAALVSIEEQAELFAPSAAAPANGAKHGPAVPPGFFAGKSPTQAYRELMKLWPGNYTPPEIASIFEAGGMVTKTRTSLVQSIHSVLKRERKRLAKEAAEEPGLRL